MKTISNIDRAHPMTVVGYVWSTSTDPALVKLANDSGNANLLNMSTMVKGAQTQLSVEETNTFLDAIFDSTLEAEFESDLQSLFCNEDGNWLSTSMTTRQALRFLDGIKDPRGSLACEVALASKIKASIDMWALEYKVDEILFSGLEK